MLSILAEFGIMTDIGFIMFDPEVTMEEIAENMAFIKKNRLDMHPSRLAKELRLVSHTSLFDKYRASGLPMKSKGLDISFDYEYTDQNVRILIKWIREISRNIEARTCELQADIRTDTKKWQDNKLIQAIVSLRNYEYTFIDECLSCYKVHGELSDQMAKSMYIGLTGRNKSVFIYE